MAEIGIPAIHWHFLRVDGLTHLAYGQIMTASEPQPDDSAARAAEVLRRVASECAPYLRDDDLSSRLFDCYWEKAEMTDPDDRGAVLEIVSEVLLNSGGEVGRWSGLLSPYLDPAGSVRQLLEPSIRADRLDEVLAPYHDRLEALNPAGPRDMSGVLELAAEIRDGCPELFRSE